MTPAADRVERWLTAWDGQGTHRTGTPGDAAGADWLAGEAAALGAAVTVEEFALDRLDPIETFLEIDKARIAAAPVFDAPATDAGGIVGRLGVDLAVAELSPRAVYTGEYERLRRQGGSRGLVILCAGDMPGMGLLNAESFRTPYGTPAIHIASEAGAIIREAAARQAPARLVSVSCRSRSNARNIVVTLAGDNPGAPPLIVMTPRSSWWQSTAERGGGIVCWLEALRGVLAAPPPRPVVFTANSGHELGHLGLDDFVSRRPSSETTATWLHWGANLGAAGGVLSVMSAGEDLRALAAGELAQAGVPHALASPSLVPSGETRDIHKKGGRYLTLVGTNRLFHLPQDRWPAAVDVAAVAAIAAAAARMTEVLAQR
jgi:hypothetical protein